jgi:hypothetical protein
MDHNNSSLTLQGWISNCELDTLDDVMGHVSFNISITSFLPEFSIHIFFPPSSPTKHNVEINKTNRKKIGMKKQLHGMKK